MQCRQKCRSPWILFTVKIKNFIILFYNSWQNLPLTSLPKLVNSVKGLKQNYPYPATLQKINIYHYILFLTLDPIDSIIKIFTATIREDINQIMWTYRSFQYLSPLFLIQKKKKIWAISTKFLARFAIGWSNVLINIKLISLSRSQDILLFFYYK